MTGAIRRPPDSSIILSAKPGRVLQRTQERSHLELEAVTLAESLKTGGYQTGFLGKWHLTNNDETHHHRSGFRRQYRRWLERTSTRCFFSPYKLAYLKDGPKGEYLTDRLTTEAIGVLDRFPERTHRGCSRELLRYTCVSFKPEKTKSTRPKKPESKIWRDDGIDGRKYRSPPFSSMKKVGENTIIFLPPTTVAISRQQTTRRSVDTKAIYTRRDSRLLHCRRTRVAQGVVSDTPIHGTDYYATLLGLAGIEKSPKPHGQRDLVPLLKGDAKFSAARCFGTIRLRSPNSFVRTGECGSGRRLEVPLFLRQKERTVQPERRYRRNDKPHRRHAGESGRLKRQLDSVLKGITRSFPTLFLRTLCKTRRRTVKSKVKTTTVIASNHQAQPSLPSSFPAFADNRPNILSSPSKTSPL